MKLKSIPAMLLLGFILFSLPIFPHLSQTTSPQKDPVNTRPPQNGSRTDEPVVAPASYGPRSDADIRFYGSHEAAYTALKAGEVDFIQWSVTSVQKLDVEADPNLAIAAYSENGMYEFDLNNNYTMATYPGVRNPLHAKEFRQALSSMVDKYHIVNFILGGVAGVLNVPVPLNSISWWPDSALPDVYRWRFNMTKAEEQLALAGFVDTDADNIRNYPAGWPGREAGPNMDPLVLYVRIEDQRLDAGRYLADQLSLFDIPYNKIEASLDVIFPIVMGDRNYHIYTGEWVGLKPYPIYLYELYHSDFWYSDGPNHVTGMNSSNLPNYPELDALLEDMYYAYSIESSRNASKLATDLGWCDLVVNIPLWSYNSFVAWRVTMPGVVNMEGYGLDNAYQFLNAYDTLGGPIRMGTINAPKTLNPLYSRWYYDYAVLDRIYSTLLSLNPYDTARLQPWVAQDWRVGTWLDPQDDLFKTKVTYYIRQDVGIVSPFGTFVRYYNAHDVDFTIWYTYAFDDSWNWASVMGVHHTSIVDDYTIEVYFDDASYWFYLAMGLQMRLLVKPELIDILCAPAAVTFASDGTNTTAGTQFKLPTTDQIVQVTSAGGLTDGVDFYIFGGYEDYEHNWIRILNDLPAGTYTINYYTPDADPHGFFLAGLPWQDTWYSIGTHYPIAIDTKNFASLNKNPYFFLETPILGEIDWYWYWMRGFKPRDGYFKISMRDVVMVMGAMDHSGTGPYDPDYFPGADLDPTDLGHVYIWDLSIVTTSWDRFFGSPPGGNGLHYYTIPEVGPLVYVNPQVIPWTVAGLGENFTISVNIFNLTAGTYAPDPEDTSVMRPLGNLYGLDIIFIWDPTVLEYVSHEVTIPVETYPDGILHDPVWEVENTVDPFAGEYRISYSSMSPANPFNNPEQSNMVFNMTFRVIKEGGSELMFTWIELPEKDGNAILFDEQNGIFTIPGDVNGDRIVDIFDIGTISAHWYPGPPIGPLGYHPNADINLDGAVDIFDIGITSAHWGQSW